MGQQQDQGDQQNDFSQAGKKQADFGLPQGHEALLAANLCAQRKNGGHVNTKCPDRVFCQSSIIGKHSGKNLRRKHHKSPEQDGVAYASHQLAIECLLDTLGFSCAKVIADQGLTALADALQGQRCQLADTGENGHRTNRQVAAVTGQAGGEADGQQTFGGQHHKAGYTQPHTGKNNFGFDFQIFFSQPKDRLITGEEAQDPDGTNRLAQHGCQRSAANSQMQDKDENRVKKDVDHRADHRGHHADFGESLGGDKGVHAQYDHYKYGTQNVDPCIIHRIGKGHIAGTEQAQKCRCKAIKQKGQHRCQNEQEGKTAAQNLFCGAVVLLTHRDRRSGCAAGTGQHGKGIDQHEDGGEQANARQRNCTDVSHVANINAVNDVVQQIDHLSHNRRDRQLCQ